MKDFSYNGLMRLCIGGKALRETHATISVTGQKIAIVSNFGVAQPSGDYKDVIIQLVDFSQQLRMPTCFINQMSINLMHSSERVEITACADPGTDPLFLEPLDPIACQDT